MTTIKKEHLDDLRRSGLNNETIKAGGFISLTAEETKNILGFEAGPGMGIEYPSLNGEPPFVRVKPDEPFKGKNDHHAKYLTAKGAGNRHYILLSVRDSGALKDPSIPLIFVEGEKKAAKGVQEGYCCIGLAGVWCFRQNNDGQSKPIPDLDHIEWAGRPVYICFDSDLAENDNVLRAECAFAKELQRRGAIVKAVRLPDGSKGEKVGLDDFLVAHGEQGKAEFDKLLEQAIDPQDPATRPLDDPVFIEPALAFVDDKVMVTRMMHGTRRRKEDKGQDKAADFPEYEIWEPRIITSEGEILQPPRNATKDPKEIIPLSNNYYLRKPLEEAQARWSIESIRSFVNGQAAVPDVVALCNDIIGAFKEWCYFPNEYTYCVISLHVLGSYFFELFPAYPYLNLNGPQGSGKTTAGRVAAALAFNGRLLIDPSQASLFRIIEREKPYLVIDEKEDIGSRKNADADPGLMALLKSGYQRGAKVSRQNTTHIEKTEYYSAYSPKLICNVHGLEDILQDRSISIITQSAPAGCTIRGYQPDLEDPIWQDLRDRLYLILMFYHQEIREHRDADVTGDHLARLREKELFKPLVDLALWIDSHSEGDMLTKGVIEALSVQKDARSFTRSLTPEAKLLNALQDLLGEEEATEVHTGQIKEAIAQQSTDTPEWCSDVWIGKTMRRLNIWRNSKDSWRERATVHKDGISEQKMLTYYRVKQDRLPER